MDDFSISQRYLMYAVGDNGSFGSLGNRKTWGCFIIAALMDLKRSKTIAMTNERNAVIEVIASLPAELSFLSPLYEHLCEKLETRLRTVLTEYFSFFSEVSAKQLFNSVGSSLVVANVVETQQRGVVSTSLGYVVRESFALLLCESISAAFAYSSGPAETSEPPEADKELIILATLVERAWLLSERFPLEEEARLVTAIKRYGDKQTRDYVRAIPQRKRNYSDWDFDLDL